jgi:hypothetical protein
MVGPNAPIYVSTDGGLTWDLAFNVPSVVGQFATHDITLRFSSSPKADTSLLYTGVLFASDLSMRIYRADDFRAATAMTQLDERTDNVDQPRVMAMTVPSGTDKGKDRLYVGFNNGFGGVHAQSASVDFALDAAASSPTFTLRLLEPRSTSGQDGYAIEPAVHSSGVVYAAYYGFRSGPSGSSTDVVVARDDNWGSGANPFTALLDPGDHLAGIRVVTGRSVPFGTIGQQRLGASNLDFAVDPSNSHRVYVAWADVPSGSTSQTLHVRNSTDGGKTWSTIDLFSVDNAVNPCLAINSVGRVGFMYRPLTGTAPNQSWETRLTLSRDAAGTEFDPVGLLIERTSSSSPTSLWQPYIGDYDHLTTFGPDFYGIFSASNYPDMANFPQGVTYHRAVDWAAHKLYTNASKTTVVAPSIDPFFFRLKTDPCYALSNEVDDMENEIETLLDAVRSGELPPPPRTPARVAAIMSYIQSLERKLINLRRQLAACHQANGSATTERQLREKLLDKPARATAETGRD